MALARVYRKASAQQDDRLPVSSYDEAVRRLVQIRCDEAVTDEAYDLAVSLISDIFWITDTRVRRDVIVAVRQLGA